MHIEREIDDVSYELKIYGEEVTEIQKRVSRHEAMIRGNIEGNEKTGYLSSSKITRSRNRNVT